MNAINQVSRPLVLIPAYGRVYKTAEDMFTDFVDGKDFKILNGPYTSIRDLETLVDMSSSVWLEDGLHAVRVG